MCPSAATKPPVLLVVICCLVCLLVPALSTLHSAVAAEYSNSTSRSSSSDDDESKAFVRNRCDIYSGRWVYDSSYPLYSSSSCPYIDAQFNCQEFGRSDTGYLKFRWMPSGCRIPRFNALYLLQKLRGKTVMFVGDSLNRNQWQSMMCLLHSVLPQSRISYVPSDPLSVFKALDYGVSIMFNRAPYLVDLDNRFVNGVNRAILRLDSIAINGLAWLQADVLIFNSGHWWTHTGKLAGWDFIEYGGRLFSSMDPMEAYLRGMTTWARWVDANIDFRKTRVFFQSYSPTHYSPQSCYGAKQPTSGITYSPSEYPPQYRIGAAVVGRMRSPVRFLNVTFMSMLRQDAHPSIYNSQRSADCSHWCIPGLPDIWNELLYYDLIF